MGSMNQSPSYMDVHGSHYSSGQSYAPQGATAGGMSHYPQYHQQPSVLQPASTYGPASSYSQYGYANGVTSPQSQPPSTSIHSQPPTQLLPLSANHSQPGFANAEVYDLTGQKQPPGAKPRVTATLWEDEGSLCYQVEARGVCVARREDNHKVNGTKLLNVAGMTRGRRDGILKSEKDRKVVKIGPMHLKGVWIPYERALEFANREHITDLLYPLFVHNLAPLLCHPLNSSQTNMVVQDSQQRRLEGPETARSQGPPPPALHHHHSMQAHVPHMAQLPQPAHAMPQSGRPSIDRAHTFPTPPASASSLMGVTHQGGSYDWNNQGMNSGVHNSQPLSIDTSLNNARSMPTTPATTPPGHNLQGMHSYQSQGYDNSKPYYSAAPSHSQYGPHQPGPNSYGHSLAPSAYIKGDMAPPSGRSSGGQMEADATDMKSDRYGPGPAHVSGGTGPVPEQEEYVQDNAPNYNARGSYTYSSNPSIGSLTGEHSQMAPDMTGSPAQPNGSGRMTPRTGGGPPSQWASGYNTPPRAAAGSLYNIVSDTRGSSGHGTPDAYGAANSAPAYPMGMNGSLGTKRLRDEDEVIRSDSRDVDYEGKRRKTITETPVGGPVGGPPLALQPVKAGGVTTQRR